MVVAVALARTSALNVKMDIIYLKINVWRSAQLNSMLKKVNAFIVNLHASHVFLQMHAHNVYPGLSSTKEIVKQVVMQVHMLKVLFAMIAQVIAPNAPTAKLVINALMDIKL